MFISSAYLRAHQTAEECRAALQNILSFEQEVISVRENADGREGGIQSSSAVDEGQAQWLERHGGYDVSPPVMIRPELRERSFGELDGTILVNYNKVRTFSRTNSTSRITALLAR